MVDVVQVVFHVVITLVMCLAANMLWFSRKLTKRQIEEVELRIQKLKQE